MVKQCADCRDGERDNNDDIDDVRLTIVKEADTGKVVKRSYMCNEHREMYLDDGYDVRVLTNGQYREA